MHTATPEAAGLSSSRLARISVAMQGYVDRGEIPGVVTLLARRGKLVHCEAHGMMDRAAGKPMRHDTIFRIYSMSKPVTCVALLRLYEEGRFLLGDPVAHYLPAFAKVKVCAGRAGEGAHLVAPERPVTIHHLLTHMAGLSYAGLPGTLSEEMYREAGLLDALIRLQVPLPELVERLAALPLVAQPGSMWHYSLAHDVVGRLVEVLAGMPFDEFLAQRIFGPLGMPDTAFHVPAGKLDRLAAMYGPAQDGQLPLVDAAATSPFLSSSYYPSGGGGLVSTPADYLRFAQMLLNGGALDGARVLSPRTVAFMALNHVPASLLPLVASPEDTRSGYGYGLGVGVVLDPAQAGILASAGQYGWDGAATTQFWVDPQEEMTGVIMAQVLPWTSAPRIMHLFQVLAHQAIVA